MYIRPQCFRGISTILQYKFPEIQLEQCITPVQIKGTTSSSLFFQNTRKFIQILQPMLNMEHQINISRIPHPKTVFPKKGVKRSAPSNKPPSTKVAYPCWIYPLAYISVLQSCKNKNTDLQGRLWRWTPHGSDLQRGEKLSIGHLEGYFAPDVRLVHRRGQDPT